MKRLDHMTCSEAEAAMAATDIVFLPQGPTEGHGNHMPLGCDWYVATAAAMLLAERTGGICLPPIPYNYAGGTAGYRPTIQIPPSLQMELTRTLIRELWNKGFRRIFCVSIHGPNGCMVGEALREVWEWEKIPAMMINPYPEVDMEKWAERIENFDGAFKEACMSYGAMKILGWEDLIPDASDLEDKDAEELGRGLPEVVKQASAFGKVGLHYTDDLQHQPPRKGLSTDLGIEMLEEAVANLAGCVDAMADYLDYLEQTGHLAPQPQRP